LKALCVSAALVQVGVLSLLLRDLFVNLAEAVADHFEILKFVMLAANILSRNFGNSRRQSAFDIGASEIALSNIGALA
jgi:hypothetical protein